jgi:leucine-rich repeat transmembrane neuronal protein 1/2
MIIFIYFFFFNSKLSSGSSNTYIFSASPNTYIAFDPWRPCLTGYIRFDIRTNFPDGTLAYIDDRGKFDFFYLKIIQGKLRLLFNLGNDRQALNVNMKINDDKWHTILIKRNGQMTSLNIDNNFVENSTITHSEDLYFGGSTYNEYESSLFYFGGNER